MMSYYDSILVIELALCFFSVLVILEAAERRSQDTFDRASIGLVHETRHTYKFRRG
jgi:hypothetical protein